MKSLKLTSFQLVTALLFSFLSWAGSSAAATTYNLDSPQGLALDSKGNLYVANNSGNNVLVYNPSYVQIPSRTVAHNVTNPTSLAIDGNGNLWVANAGSQTVAEYSSSGAQIGPGVTTAALSTSGTPYSIAIDGLGDLWVETNFETVSVYIGYAGQYSPYPFVTFSNTSDAFTGLAVYQTGAAVGTNSELQVREIPVQLAGNLSLYNIPATGFVMAYDSTGRLYSGNINETITVTPWSGSPTKTLVNLGFFPYGIAVDSTRDRIYVADAIGNKIVVYNTAGVLLHTIE